jgi:hypothetical protein
MTTESQPIDSLNFLGALAVLLWLVLAVGAIAVFAGRLPPPSIAQDSQLPQTTACRDLPRC